MSRRDWLKIIVLILLPINAWLGVFYYLNWRWEKAWRDTFSQSIPERAKFVRRARERLGIKEGQRLLYPFPFPAQLIGNPPPVGKGYPVIFLNISWIGYLEVWEPTIQEILKTSPRLHLVLLYRKQKELPEGLKPILEIVNAFNSPRLSVLFSENGEWMLNYFGTELTGFLLFLCDGYGIVRHIEPYPKLKISPNWEEEVADWRPKLHQAVKKVLNEFFPKGKER